MSKIFITGMTAPQASFDANERQMSFGGLIFDTVVSPDCKATWGAPTVPGHFAYLDEYDSVLVGISPLTSLSARHSYGALSIIEHLWGSEKLRLFIDAPNPSQVFAGLRAVKKNPASFTKPFYSYRHGWSEATEPETNERLHRAVDLLLTETWPTTLYPKLPWQGSLEPLGWPERAWGSLQGICLDSALNRSEGPSEAAERVVWSIDDPKTKWSKSTVATLAKPVVKMRENKGWTDTDVKNRLAESIGALISPQKDGTTWWTPRYMQAMSVGTPVATLWHEACALEISFAVLAAQIEDMSDRERRNLAGYQLEAYSRAIPTAEEAGMQLRQLLLPR